MDKKKYFSLEIWPDGTCAHREKRENLTVNDLRIVISLLEEIKIDMLSTLMKFRQETDLKNQTKQ